MSQSDDEPRQPVVPVGGGVPFDPETGKRYGYLPRRAAGRKLVVRAELGLGWVLGAAGAAAVLAGAAVAFVASRPDRPGPPYVDAGPLSAYPEGDVAPLPDRSGWLDRRRGLDVVAAPVAFCPADGGWLGLDGRRYDEAGRAETGPGAARLPVRAAGGRVYVDPTRPAPAQGQGEPLPPCPAPWRLGEPRPPDGR